MLTCVGFVGELVDIVEGSSLLEVVVRIGACGSKVVGSSVGRIYHVGCCEELFFLVEWRCVTIRAVPRGRQGGVGAFCWPSAV